MASDYKRITMASHDERVIAGEKVPPETLESVRKLGSQMGGEGREQGDRNSRIPAGFTFLGQFLGHDLTRDSELSFEPKNDLATLHNLRTPALDLDSLYGSGPEVSFHLYDCEQRGKFLLEEGREFDLPRNPQGTALIGDPRNDRNLILAQLHLALLKFHNAVYDRINSIEDGYIKKDELGKSVFEDRFERTQRLVRWHYQWIILREFLPLLVGPQMVRDMLIHDLPWYNWKKSGRFIPLEFSVAAYRFGHSQVHYVYRINDEFRFPIFSAKPSGDERQDLRGGPIKKKHTVNWKNFFDTGVDPTPSWDRASKKINTKLSGSLLFPQLSVVQNRPEESQSLASKGLAVRDLERGQSRGLPSGQKVAEEMESKKIDVAVRNVKNADFEEALKKDKLPPELQAETPLWYYILKEAEVQYEGMMLGDVGGRIVAEVIIGLLQADPSSLWGKVDLVHLHKVLRKDDERVKKECPKDYKLLGDLGEGDQKILQGKSGNWIPTLSIERNSDFTMADLLKFAEVDTK